MKKQDFEWSTFSLKLKSLNQKWVGMLRNMYAFNELLKDYKQSNLADLKKEVERKDKMSDYVIPASLPQLTAYKEPNSTILWLGLCLSAVLIAAQVAFLSSKGLYIIGLFELGIALLLATAASYLNKASNFTNWKIIHYMMIVAIAFIMICHGVAQASTI